MLSRAKKEDEGEKERERERESESEKERYVEGEIKCVSVCEREKGKRGKRRW